MRLISNSEGERIFDIDRGRTGLPKCNCTRAEGGHHSVERGIATRQRADGIVACTRQARYCDSRESVVEVESVAITAV